LPSLPDTPSFRDGWIEGYKAKKVGGPRKVAGHMYVGWFRFGPPYTVGTFTAPRESLEKLGTGRTCVVWPATRRRRIGLSQDCEMQPANGARVAEGRVFGVGRQPRQPGAARWRL